MTTHSTIAIPRAGHHPSWYLLLLLPVMPLLRLVIHPDGNLPTYVDGSSLFFWTTTLFFAEALALCLILPRFLDTFEWRVRKEVEQLRFPLFVSIFLVQAGLLPHSELWETSLILFAASCALLAAIPFGIEFQQRTMANLLSQPVARTEWWSVKMRVLGVALLSHWVLYMETRAICGLPTPRFLGGAALGLVIVTWAATPWWTLLARGLLAGFIFSLAAPLVTFVILIMVIDALGFVTPDRIWEWTGDEVWMLLLFCLAGPVYAPFAYFRGRRKWLTLEASDNPVGEGGVLSLPMFRRDRGHPAVGARTGVLVQLVSKEVRIQTATLLMGVATLVMGGCLLLPMPFFKLHETMAHGGFSMLAAATILLAGASTVAEERRLGTLDSHRLLPISLGFQWCAKIGVALAIAAVAALLIFISNPPVAVASGMLNALTGGVLLFTLFAAAVLASSDSNNTLTALLLAVGLSVAGFLLAAAATDVVQAAADDNSPMRWMGIRQNLAEWKQRAANFNPPDRYEGMRRVGNLQWFIPLLFRPMMALPGVLALFLAWRNFRTPMGGRNRLGLQVASCYLAALCLFASEGVVNHLAKERYAAFMDLVMVKDHITWERRTTEAEHELYERFGQSPIDSINHTIRVPEHEGGFFERIPTVPLPLSPEHRQALIQGPNAIPAALRAQLVEDAERDPRKAKPIVPPPQASAAPTDPTQVQQFRMSPELMRRYGLIPRDAAVRRTSPATNNAVMPPTQPAPAEAPSVGAEPKP